jgi:uncharacterized membrane protein
VTDVDAAGVPPPQPADVKQRRLKWMLIASLAVNLLVIGVVAGAMISGKHRHRPGGAERGEDYGLMSFTRQLSSERRGQVRKAIKEQRETLRPLRESVDGARREAADLLVVEPFNRDRVKEAFDKITDADVKLKSAGLAMFLTTAESLTPDERQKLKEWWIKRQGRDRGRGERPGPKEDGPPPPEAKGDQP